LTKFGFLCSTRHRTNARLTVATFEPQRFFNVAPDVVRQGLQHLLVNLKRTNSDITKAQAQRRGSNSYGVKQCDF